MAGIDSLILSDGTTSINLMDGVNYALRTEGWAPQIAQRNHDSIGGRGQYDDVTESLLIDIFGATLAAMLAAEVAISRLLDQATRFANGDTTVSPVTIAITMTGSAALSAMVLGGSLARPANFADRTVVNEIEGATLTIDRRGQWLAAAEAAINTTATAGQVWSIAMSNHAEPSPITLDWSIPVTTVVDGYQFYTQLLVLSNSINNILVVEGESLASGAGIYTSGAVANARGGNTLVFSPTLADTRYYTDSVAPPAGLSSSPGDWAVFASGQGLSTSWTIQSQLLITLNTAQVIQTPLQPWPNTPPSYSGGSGNHALLLGVVSIPSDDAISNIALGMMSNSAGANKAVVDYLVFARLGPDTHVITFDQYLDISPGFGNVAGMVERIDPRPLSALTPVAQIGRSDGTKRTAIGHQGDLMITQRGTTLAGIWVAANGPRLGTGGYSGGAYRVVSQAGVLHTATFSAVRRKGYQVPQ